MPAKVSLTRIAQELEMQFDEYLSFLDRETGEVYSISKEVLSAVEEGEDDEEDEDNLPEPPEDEYDIARLICETGDRFIRLPTKFDVHEWQIMADFANSLESARLREELNNAIHGSGAFRYFKDIIRRRKIEQDWYDYRDEALREIAKEWCEEHGLEYEE